MTDPKNIRLVCTDVDHTILNDKQELSPFTKSILEQLQERGIKIIVATGKNLNSTRNVVDPLNMDDPLIFANGSLIQYRDGKILRKHTLSKQALKDVLALGKQQGLSMLLYYPNCTVGIKNDKFVSALAKYGGPKPKLIDNWGEIKGELENVLKIVFINTEEPDRLEKMEDQLNHEVGSAIDCIMSLPFLLEVQPSGISKGFALDQVAKLLSIPQESIIAFGDGDNDIEMLQYAGIGVALSNASPNLLATADAITATNNEDGPAKFLQNYFNLH